MERGLRRKKESESTCMQGGANGEFRIEWVGCMVVEDVWGKLLHFVGMIKGTRHEVRVLSSHSHPPRKTWRVGSE